MTTKTIYNLILYYIYIHTSKTSGKSYIGVSDNPERRKYHHKLNAFNPNSRMFNTHFKRAIRKYGIDDFQTTILWQTPCKDTAYLAEVYFIALYDTYKNGYNETFGGDKPPSNKGIPHTQETKDKISKAQLGKKLTQEHKDKISKGGMGRITSIKTKNKIRKALTGLKRTKESIIRISISKCKTYKITYPSGSSEVITNLKEFSKYHNLNYVCMLNVSRYEQKHHQNYICKCI